MSKTSTLVSIIDVEIFDKPGTITFYAGLNNKIEHKNWEEIVDEANQFKDINKIIAYYTAMIEYCGGEIKETTILPIYRIDHLINKL